MKVALVDILRNIPERADGYYEDVISRGTIVGDDLELTDEAFKELAEKYQGMPVPSLSIKEKLENFEAAVAKWRRYNFQIVTRDQFKERVDICQGTGETEPCVYWLKDRLIPSCSVCGCGKIKHEFATEECPLPGALKKWQAVVK